MLYPDTHHTQCQDPQLAESTTKLELKRRGFVCCKCSQEIVSLKYVKNKLVEGNYLVFVIERQELLETSQILLWFYSSGNLRSDIKLTCTNFTHLLSIVLDWVIPNVHQCKYMDNRVHYLWLINSKHAVHSSMHNFYSNCDVVTFCSENRVRSLPFFNYAYCITH